MSIQACRGELRNRLQPDPAGECTAREITADKRAAFAGSVDRSHEWIFILPIGRSPPSEAAQRHARRAIK